MSCLFVKSFKNVYRVISHFFLKGLDENGFLVYNTIVYCYVHTLLSALYPHNANYVRGSFVKIYIHPHNANYVDFLFSG